MREESKLRRTRVKTVFCVLVIVCAFGVIVSAANQKCDWVEEGGVVSCFFQDGWPENYCEVVYENDHYGCVSGNCETCTENFTSNPPKRLDSWYVDWIGMFGGEDDCTMGDSGECNLEDFRFEFGDIVPDSCAHSNCSS